MANRAFPYACNIGPKIIVWNNGHGVQLEYLEAYISKMVNTSKAVVVIQALFSWQTSNSEYVGPWLVESSWTRDRIHVLSIGRWIPIRYTTMESQRYTFI